MGSCRSGGVSGPADERRPPERNLSASTAPALCLKSRPGTPGWRDQGTGGVLRSRQGWHRGRGSGHSSRGFFRINMNLSGCGKEGKTGSEELIDDPYGVVANARIFHLNQHKSLIRQHPAASEKTAPSRSTRFPSPLSAPSAARSTQKAPGAHRLRGLARNTVLSVTSSPSGGRRISSLPRWGW